MENEDKFIGKLVMGGIALVFLVILAFSSFGSVPIGSKGIRTQLGVIKGSLDNGVYMKIPFFQKVVKMNVQNQKEQVDAEASSSDLQVVHTQVAVNYNVYPDKIANLYQEIGTEYKTVVIDPAIQEAVKSATAKYTAENLITKRQEVQDEIKHFLVERLAPKYIQVTDLSIINFDFSSQFNNAIESKVTAEQNALAAKNKLEQANYEAQAIKITSEAANNEKYIQLQSLDVEREAIKKWNGVLPQQMIPGSTVPFINLNK